MGWFLKDKTTVDPTLTDNIIVGQENGNDFTIKKTTLQKIKELLLGTTVMGTTADTVTGAVKEINNKIGTIDIENDGDIAAQLNALAQNVNKIWNKEIITFVPAVDYSLIYNESYRVGNLIIINLAIKRTDENIINGNFNIGAFTGINNPTIKLLNVTAHSQVTINALNSAIANGLIGTANDVWISITNANDTKGIVLSAIFIEGGN